MTAVARLPVPADLDERLTTDPDDRSWWTDALCNTGGSGLTAIFFSDDLQDIAAAKRLCATCPVMVDCLEGALARREPLGVWGGQLFSNGRILADKRRPGRPAKTLRPEDRLPEIPLPVHLRSA